MNKNYLSLPVVLLCAALTQAVPTAQAQLSVGFGSAGLQTTTGSSNDVWSATPAPGLMFDQWTGDTALLSDPFAWHSKATVPATASMVTATFKKAPTLAPTTWVVNGLAQTDVNAVKAVYHFPPSPTGVIFFFHGAGGSASMFFTQTETLQFSLEAVSAGYAVIALDSNNRKTKDWSTDATLNNPDTKNVQACITRFTNLGLIKPGTALYATGMSNGGGFAPKPAALLTGFKGCAIWCAAGAPVTLFAQTTVPTIWSLAKNDDLYTHTTNLNAAMTNQAKLNKRGIANSLLEYLPSALHPARFERIAGLTPTDSLNVFSLIKNGGYLDASNYLLADPVKTDWTKVLPINYKKYGPQILVQLSCCYSGHQFFSEANNRVLDFFDAHR